MVHVTAPRRRTPASLRAETRLRDFLCRQRRTLISDYLGNRVKVLVSCVNGHQRWQYPCHILKGFRCANCPEIRRKTDSIQAEINFDSDLDGLGWVRLEPKWLGNTSRHLVRCDHGHERLVTPANLHAGKGCGQCLVEHTVFYVVQSPGTGIVKLGISSGTGKDRLYTHAREGYIRRHRLHTGLSIGVAPALERQILHALRNAGETPVRGREYFPGHCLPLILDLVDNDPDVRALLT